MSILCEGENTTYMTEQFKNIFYSQTNTKANNKSQKKEKTLINSITTNAFLRPIKVAAKSTSVTVRMNLNTCVFLLKPEMMGKL
jgi:hypothetical protein